MTYHTIQTITGTINNTSHIDMKLPLRHRSGGAYGTV